MTLKPFPGSPSTIHTGEIRGGPTEIPAGVFPLDGQAAISGIRGLTGGNEIGTVLAEPSRAEPSRAEPSRAEPSRAEPSRAEPSRAEPSRAEPSRAEPSRAEPSRAEPSRAEPSRAEPSRAEPSRAEPSRAEPSRAEPSRAEPSRAEPFLCPHAGRFSPNMFRSARLTPRAALSSPRPGTGSSTRRPERRSRLNPNSRRPAGALSPSLPRFRRSPRWRSWSMPGVVWATLFLVLSAVFVSPALAQTTFVSNTGQTASGESGVGPLTNGNWRHRQFFSTGANSDGYTLSEVDLRISDNTNSDEDAASLRVRIFNVSNGNLGTSRFTLNNPSSFSNDAVNTFTAPTGSTLDANTTYAVVLDSTSTTKVIRVRDTASDDEDTGGESGWSIADTRDISKDFTSWLNISGTLMFAIKGTAGTTPANNAPTVANAIQDQTATVGTMFSFAFPANTFSDADNETLTYMATKSDGMALPTWLSFADSTRTFSGTPGAADVGTLSVKVTASDGTDSVSDTFDIEVSAAAAPGQVTGVTVTPGVGSLAVSWTAVTGATGYKVQWKSGSQNYDATNRQATVGAVTSHTIPSLTAGTQYTVRVIATKTNANDGTPSAEKTGTPKAAAPGQVTGVSVTPGVGSLAVSVDGRDGCDGLQGAVEVRVAELRKQPAGLGGSGDEPHDPQPDGGDAIHGAGDRDEDERQ